MLDAKNLSFFFRKSGATEGLPKWLYFTGSPMEFKIPTAKKGTFQVRISPLLLDWDLDSSDARKDGQADA